MIGVNDRLLVIDRQRLFIDRRLLVGDVGVLGVDGGVIGVDDRLLVINRQPLFIDRRFLVGDVGVLAGDGGGLDDRPLLGLSLWEALPLTLFAEVCIHPF